MSRRIDKEEAAHLQYETEHTEPPKSRSVVIYMVILVAAAFLLLLLAYFMQQRTAENVEGLHQTVNSFQTIDQLVEDNRLLQEETARLKEEKAELEQELSNTQWERNQAQSALTDARDASKEGLAQAHALNTLNQLRVLYNKGRYREAQELLEANPTTEFFLSAVNEGLTDEELDIYDPLAAYQRIAKLLGVD